MSANGSNGFLNIEDANLRVRSGNVYAKGITVGGITVGASHGLQSVSDVSNTTSNTLQFTNATTSFKATSNIEVGGDVSYTSKPKISVESNVVTEYTGPHDRPLRKYPEVALTANSDKGYVASASSSLTSTPAYLAFDGSTGTTWHTQYPYYTENGGVYDPGNAPGALGTYSGTLPSHELVSGYTGEYITLGLPNKIKMSKISINTRVDAGLNLDQTQSAEVIVVVGSHDGSTWEFVDTHTVGKYPDDNTIPYTFNVNTSTYYEHVGLICTNTGPTDSTYNTAWSISKLAFYGYEEGSGSLDTTLKSVYNVPATTGTQLEVYYDGRETSSYSGSGTTVTDISPNTNNGTLNGGVGFDTTYKAFTFNGTTTRNITATLPSTVTGEYVHSVSLWVKADEVSRTSSGMFTFFTIGSASSANMIALGVNTTSNGIKYDFYDASVTVESPQITSNEWMHFVVTYSGGANNLAGAKRVYLNGKELSVSYGGNSSSSPLSLPTSPTLTLGGQLNSSNPPFSGSIANFRLYSKALNADQVKELYDYQKDYFLGSKSQLTLYKGHLGVGVTEPSGQLELAGDERIQEYPPRDLGGFETMIEGEGTYKVSSSSEITNPTLGSYDHPATAFTANDTFFRGITSDYDVGSVPAPYIGIHFTNGTGGDFLQIELPYKIYLKSINITARTLNSLIDRAPHTGFIFGSNDSGTTWSQVTSWSGLNWTVGESKPIQINSNTLYSTYRLVANKLSNSTGTASRFNIDRWQLFGTPGPTTLDKGSLTLGRSLDVPRVSRYDVDTETPRPEKLVVDFDTTVNSSPTDISGQGNHGTFYNGASYSAADKAFVFDGTDDYIQGSCPASLSGNVSYTIALWVKFDTITTNNYDGIVEIGDRATNTTSGTFPSIFVYHGANLGFYFSNGGAIVNSGVLPVAGRWYHLVAVYDQGGNKGHFYIDGGTTFTGSGTPANTTNFLSTASVFLGGDSTASSGQYLDGKISNFKLYNVALEPSEVRKLYNLGRTGRSMVISDTAVGIGKVPEAQLDVRGNLNVDGVITNQQRPAFYVWRDDTSGTTAYKNSTGVITNWDSKRIDTAGTFDLSNGRYYIPVSGLYNFVGAGLYRYGGSGNGILEVSFYVNGSNVNVRGISYNRGNTTNEHHTVTITFMRFMNAGDYVQMGIYDCQTACDLYYGDGLGYFSGYLLG